MKKKLKSLQLFFVSFSLLVLILPAVGSICIMDAYCKPHAEQNGEICLFPDLQEDDVHRDFLCLRSPFTPATQEIEFFKHFPQSSISHLGVQAFPVLRC